MEALVYEDESGNKTLFNPLNIHSVRVEWKERGSELEVVVQSIHTNNRVSVVRKVDGISGRKDVEENIVRCMKSAGDIRFPMHPAVAKDIDGEATVFINPNVLFEVKMQKTDADRWEVMAFDIYGNKVVNLDIELQTAANVMFSCYKDSIQSMK